MNNLIRVVVAIIKDEKNRVLITQRMADRVQPHLWEFPGGKITLYETGLQALKREIFEEVDIKIEKAMPFMQLHHDYKDYSVWLDIWQVEKYTGTARGKEGQNIAWVESDRLKSYQFLDANKNIFKALALAKFHKKIPSEYKVEGYLQSIKKAKEDGFDQIELDAQNLSPKDYKKLIEEATSLSNALNLKLILFDTFDKLQEFPQLDGISMKAKDLLKQKSRPVSSDKLFCLWCKDKEDIKVAELLEADFIILSPILNIENGLGWSKFQRIANSTNLPIYAYGKIDASMFSRVRALGGIGCLL